MKIGLRSGVSMIVLVSASVASAQVAGLSNAILASAATLQDAPQTTPNPAPGDPNGQEQPAPAQPEVKKGNNFFGLPFLALLGLGGAAGAAAALSSSAAASPPASPS